MRERRKVKKKHIHKLISKNIKSPEELIRFLNSDEYSVNPNQKFDFDIETSSFFFASKDNYYNIVSDIKIQKSNFQLLNHYAIGLLTVFKLLISYQANLIAEKYDENPDSILIGEKDSVNLLLCFCIAVAIRVHIDLNNKKETSKIELCLAKLDQKDIHSVDQLIKLDFKFSKNFLLNYARSKIDQIIKDFESEYENIKALNQTNEITNKSNDFKITIFNLLKRCSFIKGRFDFNLVTEPLKGLGPDIFFKTSLLIAKFDSLANCIVADNLASSHMNGNTKQVAKKNGMEKTESHLLKTRSYRCFLNDMNSLVDYKIQELKFQKFIGYLQSQYENLQYDHYQKDVSYQIHKLKKLKISLQNEISEKIAEFKISKFQINHLETWNSDLCEKINQLILVYNARIFAQNYSNVNLKATEILVRNLTQKVKQEVKKASKDNSRTKISNNKSSYEDKPDQVSVIRSAELSDKFYDVRFVKYVFEEVDKVFNNIKSYNLKIKYIDSLGSSYDTLLHQSFLREYAIKRLNDIINDQYDFIILRCSKHNDKLIYYNQGYTVKDDARNYSSNQNKQGFRYLGQEFEQTQYVNDQFNIIINSFETIGLKVAIKGSALFHQLSDIDLDSFFKISKTEIDEINDFFQQNKPFSEEFIGKFQELSLLLVFIKQQQNYRFFDNSIKPQSLCNFKFKNIDMSLYFIDREIANDYEFSPSSGEIYKKNLIRVFLEKNKPQFDSFNSHDFLDELINEYLKNIKTLESKLSSNLALTPVLSESYRGLNQYLVAHSNSKQVTIGK